MNVFKELLERRDLLRNLVSRELKIRYRGSALGFLWSVLIPLFMALIYVVFLRMLARDVPLSEILIGVFAWQFTVQSVNSGLGSITGNVSLVKKVYFPRIILPVSATLANLINFLLSLLVQFPLVAILLHLNGQALSPWTLVLPLVIVIHFVFNLALAFLMAGINVYYRDAQHLVGVALMAWFFVSPVMYNLQMVQHHASSLPHVMDLYMLNPMAVIITAYRALILPGADFPSMGSAMISLAGSALLLLVAYVVFQRMQRNFADML